MLWLLLQQMPLCRVTGRGSVWQEEGGGLQKNLHTGQKSVESAEHTQALWRMWGRVFVHAVVPWVARASILITTV